MIEWDSKLPASVAEVIDLLERRIFIHQHWLQRLLKKEDRALKAESYGVGTIDSHQTYINQYRAAIKVLSQ